MPPRIPLPASASIQHGPSTATIFRCFSATPSSQASTVKQRRRHRDPYAIAQAKARKTANLSRQEVLKAERSAAFGDPVRGKTTPYVLSLDTGTLPDQAESSTKASSTSSNVEVGLRRRETDAHLNYYVSEAELDKALGRSRQMTSPVSLEHELEGVGQAASDKTGSPGQSKPDFVEDILDGPGRNPSNIFRSRSAAGYMSGTTPAQRAKQVKEGQETAEEAMKRIASLSLGSSKDRLRLNKQRIIDTFGRHNTDATLPPKLQSSVITDQIEKTPRVGPDTGSSEVQIGILTAKIRTLADYLGTRGRMDKVNKRNLRLLVHRRAKLLKYLRRKERGGPRWQNLIETLGLTEGTWKGEITL